MSKFKIGDRVAINPNQNEYASLEGSGTGRIINHSKSLPHLYLVLSDNGEEYSISENLLIKVPEITIYQYKGTVVATCDDDCATVDNMDFYKGAKTALNKLVTEMTQPYNAQVVCIESDDCLFKVGKVYQVENGFLKSDHLIINKAAYRNFKALESDITTAKFVQLVD